MLNILLDFTQAACPHREVSLEATCGTGTVQAVVPPGRTVRIDPASTNTAHITHQATGPADPTAPVLTGLGHLRIRTHQDQTAPQAAARRPPGPTRPRGGGITGSPQQRWPARAMQHTRRSGDQRRAPAPLPGPALARKHPDRRAAAPHRGRRCQCVLPDSAP